MFSLPSPILVSDMLAEFANIGITKPNIIFVPSIAVVDDSDISRAAVISMQAVEQAYLRDGLDGLPEYLCKQRFNQRVSTAAALLSVRFNVDVVASFDNFEYDSGFAELHLHQRCLFQISY